MVSFRRIGMPCEACLDERMVDHEGLVAEAHLLGSIRRKEQVRRKPGKRFRRFAPEILPNSVSIAEQRATRKLQKIQPTYFD